MQVGIVILIFVIFQPALAIGENYQHEAAQRRGSQADEATWELQGEVLTLLTFQTANC